MEGETLELSSVQKVIAKRMSLSRDEIPDFSLRLEVDMTDAISLRRDASIEFTLNDLILKATAIALQEHPTVNATFDQDVIRLSTNINIGFAVAVPGALFVPVIRDAATKPVEAVAEESKLLIARVREGRIEPADLQGGTFTISNLGMFGIDQFDAVINPPQAGILAVGRVAPRAVVTDNQVGVRATCALSLTCDHRVVYGAEAATFLSRIKRLLEDPAAL